MTLALQNPTPAPIRLRRYARHGLLTQLAAFAAVMRVGSVTRAAESLCIAQPTLSGQLRKLEEALDVRLFEPHGRRLAPTAAAHVLLQAADEVQDALERCERGLGDVRRAVTASGPATGCGAGTGDTGSGSAARTLADAPATFLSA